MKFPSVFGVSFTERCDIREEGKRDRKIERGRKVEVDREIEKRRKRQEERGTRR